MTSKRWPPFPKKAENSSRAGTFEDAGFFAGEEQIQKFCGPAQQRMLLTTLRSSGQDVMHEIVPVLCNRLAQRAGKFLAILQARPIPRDTLNSRRPVRPDFPPSFSLP